MEKYFTPKEPLNPGPVWLDKWILDTGGESFHQTVLAIVATLGVTNRWVRVRRVAKLYQVAAVQT